MFSIFSYLAEKRTQLCVLPSSFLQSTWPHIFVWRILVFDMRSRKIPLSVFVILSRTWRLIKRINMCLCCEYLAGEWEELRTILVNRLNMERFIMLRNMLVSRCTWCQVLSYSECLFKIQETRQLKSSMTILRFKAVMSHDSNQYRH